MKLVKRSLGGFLALVCLMALVACGSSDAVKGTWKVYGMDLLGTVMTVDDLGALMGEDQVEELNTFYLTFDGAGKMSGNVGDESVEGTYEIDGSDVTITFEGESQVFTLDASEGTLTLTADGIGVIFKKS